MKKIRVLLAEDHQIVRAGIRLLVESQSDMEVVAEAVNGLEALAKARQFSPDIAVMDIGMPDMNGLEATRRIRAELPAVRVLALTMHDNEEYFFELLSSGGSGYVLKNAAPTELVAAIRAVADGGYYLYPTVARALVDDYLRRVRTGDEKSSYDGLTSREREVLKLIAEGCTNQEIAEKLFLSVKTVETHRANIMQKLNMHSRTELVKYAIRKGLIDIET